MLRFRKEGLCSTVAEGESGANYMIVQFKDEHTLCEMAPKSSETNVIEFKSFEDAVRSARAREEMYLNDEILTSLGERVFVRVDKLHNRFSNNIECNGYTIVSKVNDDEIVFEVLNDNGEMSHVINHSEVLTYLKNNVCQD